MTPDEEHELVKQLWLALVRVVLAAAFVLGAYAFMPTDAGNWWWAAIPMTLLGLVLFTIVFVRQLRKVSHADYPILRAVEALIFTVLLFLVLFAAVSVQLDAHTTGSYSESLTKVDGFYFAVTTMATVGYGDITPVTTTARVIGSIQMLGNLVLLGVAVRMIGKAVEQDGGGRLRPRRGGTDPAP